MQRNQSIQSQMHITFYDSNVGTGLDPDFAPFRFFGNSQHVMISP